MVKFLIKLLCLFLLLNSCNASQYPRLFLFFGPDTKLDLKKYRDVLSIPAVSGAQVVYSWKELEPRKDKYDFSRIERDVKYLRSLHKKLFIQLQDRSFQPQVYFVPDYLRSDPEYHGGVAMQYDFPGEGKSITTGWAPRVWESAVRLRFQKLFAVLAKKFDGQIAGINLPETAVDFDRESLPEGFTEDGYFDGELENISVLRHAFHHGIIMQYVNFFPGEWDDDHHYMSRFFEYALHHDIAIGGPDVVPFRNNHMKNSYPFLNRYGAELTTVGMAIQESDYTYKNPASDNYYTFADFYTFSRDYLHASILFWNLEEPFFTSQLLPAMNADNFEQA